MEKKKKKDYAFRRQFKEKPSITPGCPGQHCIPQISFLEHTDGAETMQ